MEPLRDRKEVKMPRMQRLSGDYEIRDVRRRQIIWGFVVTVRIPAFTPSRMENH